MPGATVGIGAGTGVGLGVGAGVATTGSAQRSSEMSISNLLMAALPGRQRRRHVRACIVLLVDDHLLTARVREHPGRGGDLQLHKLEH